MDIEWHYAKNPVDYDYAQIAMKERVQGILQKEQSPLVWCLSHPPVYTGGRRALQAHVLNASIPYIPTNRGGEVTYHGPGQLVVYAMLDLAVLKKNIPLYVRFLEKWVQHILTVYAIEARSYPDRVGLWVQKHPHRPLESEEKIAAIGVHVKRWVTSHGFALNINPHLQHFTGIIPCGLSNHGVTSFEKLGIYKTIEDIIPFIKESFYKALKDVYGL
jgi:lipoyl(octanoyl) transferase